MLTSFHGNTGVATIQISYIGLIPFLTEIQAVSIACVFGGVISILSHWIFDCMNENKYKGFKKEEYLNLGLLMLLGIGSLFYTWLLIPIMVVGWSGGNGFDLWDKILLLSEVFPSKFKRREDIPCHKIKPLYNLTKKQTQYCNRGSLIVVILLSIIIIIISTNNI